MRHRQKRSWPCVPCTNPRPTSPARLTAILALNLLIAGAARILLGIEKVEMRSRRAIGSRTCRRPAPPAPPRGRASREPSSGSRQIRCGDQNRQQRDGGSQIRLAGDEGQRDRSENRRDDEVEMSNGRTAAFTKQLRQHQRERRLGEFRRLEISRCRCRSDWRDPPRTAPKTRTMISRARMAT